MKTIRTKLVLLFLMFMISLVSCGILLNALFLERYYIYKNKDTFIETSTKIYDEYIRNKRNIPAYINMIDRLNGISCTITDKNLNTKYNSFPQKLDSDATRIPKEIEQIVFENKRELRGEYIYTIVEKQNDQAPKLVFLTRMSNGHLMILSKQMKGISESVAIANEFYLLAGLIIILLGGMFIYVFSKRITHPIIEMSTLAKAISNLEFDKRVIVNSQDEIGILGKSINQISEKLNTSMNTLKQDVERRKQLVRNISHELKTPIGVIKGYTEGLKYGVAENQEKRDKYCTVIADECDRMDRMVQELLSLSKLETGSFQLNISKFDISELVQKVVERFNPIFIEKDISVKLEYENAICVTADYDLMDRVVNNYITNAINHCEGRKIIKVAIEKKDKGIRISVFNTGKEIPEQELENIWDVFYKVDKVRTRQHSGHGLGLSIVSLIAQLHGGITGVKNLNEGVLFFFEIP